MQTLIELVSDSPSGQLASTINTTVTTMTVQNLTGTWPTPVSGISKFRFNFGPGTEECECTNISGSTWTIKRAVNGISASHNAGDSIFLPFNHNTVGSLMPKGGGTFGGPVTHGTDYAVPNGPTRPLTLTMTNGGSVDAGVHPYVVTCVDANGYESAPSPLATVTANASLGNAGAPGGPGLRGLARDRHGAAL